VGATRKFEGALKALVPITSQKDIAQFLNNAENAQKLNNLVDDIHEAVIEYQVCTPKALALIAPNVCLRPPCNKISTTAPAC